MAGSPTSSRSRGWPRRAWTSSWPTRPTPRCPASRPPRGAHAGDRAGVPHLPRPGHRLQLRQPRAPHPAGAGRRPRPRPQGRLRRPLDGPQHGHRPGPGLPQHPRRAGGRPQAAGEAAGQQDHAHLHRVTGRADGGPVPDGQPGPHDPHHRGRHGPPGQLADPGQRERHLPGDQRAHPLRRERGPQGQRQGARLRARQRRRAGLLLQHHQAVQRAARARGVAPPAGQRRPRDPHRGATPTGRSSPRTDRSSTWSTASPRSPARSPRAWCTSTRRPWAARPRSP